LAGQQPYECKMHFGFVCSGRGLRTAAEARSWSKWNGLVATVNPANLVCSGSQIQAMHLRFDMRSWTSWEATAQLTSLSNSRIATCSQKCWLCESFLFKKKKKSSVLDFYPKREG